MEKIKELNDNIFDELHDAAKYAKLAMKYKDDDSALCRNYLQKSKDELGHADSLHNDVVRVIKEYRAENGEPPAPMMAIYNWEHDKAIDKTAHIKALQNMVEEK